jgi:hypothetical protein
MAMDLDRHDGFINRRRAASSPGTNEEDVCRAGILLEIKPGMGIESGEKHGDNGRAVSMALPREAGAAREGGS